MAAANRRHPYGPALVNTMDLLARATKRRQTAAGPGLVRAMNWIPCGGVQTGAETAGPWFGPANPMAVGLVSPPPTSMKATLQFRPGAAVVTAGLMLLAGACTYDPYYYDSYYGSSYGGAPGHGYGHGYGSSSFSTSVFVSTSSSRWAYDPYCNAYYDYERRSYYDPYLRGYYPVGYRPQRLRGVPHPHGWQPGQTQVSAPTQITNVTLNNYQQRESSYRRLNHSWARQVQADAPDPDPRSRDRRGQTPAPANRSRQAAQGSTPPGSWQRQENQRPAAQDNRSWTPQAQGRRPVQADPRPRLDRSRSGSPPSQTDSRAESRPQEAARPQRQTTPPPIQRSQPSSPIQPRIAPQPPPQPEPRQQPQQRPQPPQEQPRPTPPRRVAEQPLLPPVQPVAAPVPGPSPAERGGGRGGDRAVDRGDQDRGERSGGDRRGR